MQGLGGVLKAAPVIFFMRDLCKGSALVLVALEGVNI